MGNGAAGRTALEAGSVYPPIDRPLQPLLLVVNASAHRPGYLASFLLGLLISRLLPAGFLRGSMYIRMAGVRAACHPTRSLRHLFILLGAFVNDFPCAITCLAVNQWLTQHTIPV